VKKQTNKKEQLYFGLKLGLKSLYTMSPSASPTVYIRRLDGMLKETLETDIFSAMREKQMSLIRVRGNKIEIQQQN